MILTAGETIEMDGHTWVIAAHDGRNTLRLRQLDTGELRVTTVDEYVAQTPPSDLLTAVLNRIDDESVAPLLPHAREILFGELLDNSAERELLYGSDVGRMQKYANKSAELQKAGWTHVSAKKIMRRCQEYERTHDLSALMDRRRTRKFDPWHGIDKDIKTACLVVIEEARLGSTVTNIQLATRARKLYQTLNPEKAASAPRTRKFLRIMETRRGQAELSAKTRRTEDIAPKRSHRPYQTTIPGELVEMDTTVVDVQVRDTNGHIIRPEITVLMDVHTRAALSVLVTTKTTGEDIAEMVADSMTLPKTRPTEYAPPFLREIERLPMCWAKYVDPAVREEIDATRPRVRIRQLMTDNGKAYLASNVALTLARNNIDHIRAAKGVGPNKGHIERFFLSVNTLYLQSMPGYVGRSTDHRGTPTPPEKLLDLETFAYLIDYLIMHEYNNREHDYLSDPRFPDDTRRISPNAAYAMALQHTSFVPKRLSQTDYIAWLRSKAAVINRKGVRSRGLQFSSPELIDFYNSPDYREGRKYRVHYRLNDRSRVWVYVQENRFIAADVVADHRMVPLAGQWDSAGIGRLAHPPLSSEDAAIRALDIVDGTVEWAQSRGRGASRAQNDAVLKRAQGRVDYDERESNEATDDASTAPAQQPPLKIEAAPGLGGTWG